MNLGQYFFLFVLLLLGSRFVFAFVFNLAEPLNGYSHKREQRINFVIWLLSFGVALSWTLLS